MLDIVNKIENGENLSKDEAKGIMGRSLLLEIPYFNFVLDAPCEYLHSVCIGVVKRVVILTFNVGEIRPRITKRKLSSPEQFNRPLIKFPRESSRRARKMDITVMKAQ